LAIILATAWRGRTAGGRCIFSPDVARRTRPGRSRRRVLVFPNPAPWLGRVPIAKFLLQARPGVGPVSSKILAKILDLRRADETSQSVRTARGGAALYPAGR